MIAGMVLALGVLAGPGISAADAAPSLQLRPPTVEFGAVAVGGGLAPAQTVTVTNTGDSDASLSGVAVQGADAAAFPLVPGGDSCTGATLAPADECEVEVDFEPPAVGAASAVLEVSGDASGQVALSGEGVFGKSSISPAGADFGSTRVGASTVFRTFQVTNTGLAPIAIGAVALTGPGRSEFRLGTTDACSEKTLGPGEGCIVKVLFAPTSVGAAVATLLVPGTAPVSAHLAGTGVAPDLATPTVLDFGAQPLGGLPARASTTVVNSGSAPLAVGPVSLGGPGASAFALVGDRCEGRSLAPGQGCTIEVAFTPPALSPVGAVVVIGGEVPGQIPLSGSGFVPLVAASPPVPVAPEPAKVLLELRRGRLGLGAGGTVRFELGCEAPEGADCASTLTVLPAPGSPKLPARLGSWTGSIPAGESREVGIRLVRAARRALASRGRLPLVLQLDGPDGSSRATVVLHRRS